MGTFLERRQLGGGLFWAHSEGLQLGILPLVAGFLCTGCRMQAGAAGFGSSHLACGTQEGRAGSTAKAAAAKGAGRADALGMARVRANGPGRRRRLNRRTNGYFLTSK